MTPLQGKCFGTNCSSFKSLFSTSFYLWVPPPFHLPAALAKPGPQRHLLPIVGSGTPLGPVLGPLPAFLNLTMGGRGAFWLLSQESVLKITYRAVREPLLRFSCGLKTPGKLSPHRRALGQPWLPGGKSKACDITARGWVSTPQKPAVKL